MYNFIHMFIWGQESRVVFLDPLLHEVDFPGSCIWPAWLCWRWSCFSSSVFGIGKPLPRRVSISSVCSIVTSILAASGAWPMVRDRWTKSVKSACMETHHPLSCRAWLSFWPLWAVLTPPSLKETLLYNTREATFLHLWKPYPNATCLAGNIWTRIVALWMPLNIWCKFLNVFPYFLHLFQK